MAKPFSLPSDFALLCEAQRPCWKFLKSRRYSVAQRLYSRNASLIENISPIGAHLPKIKATSFTQRASNTKCHLPGTTLKCCLNHGRFPFRVFRSSFQRFPSWRFLGPASSNRDKTSRVNIISLCKFTGFYCVICCLINYKRLSSCLLRT